MDGSVDLEWTGRWPVRSSNRSRARTYAVLATLRESTVEGIEPPTVEARSTSPVFLRCLLTSPKSAGTDDSCRKHFSGLRQRVPPPAEKGLDSHGLLAVRDCYSAPAAIFGKIARLGLARACCTKTHPTGAARGQSVPAVSGAIQQQKDPVLPVPSTGMFRSNLGRTGALTLFLRSTGRGPAACRVLRKSFSFAGCCPPGTVGSPTQHEMT
jgi:hypothetical protein